MHLEALGTLENTGGGGLASLIAPGSPRNTGEHWRGWVGISDPLKWCVISIFWPFFAYFLFFFMILCDFHAFGCTWKP